MPRHTRQDKPRRTPLRTFTSRSPDRRLARQRRADELGLNPGQHPQPDDTLPTPDADDAALAGVLR